MRILSMAFVLAIVALGAAGCIAEEDSVSDDEAASISQELGGDGGGGGASCRNKTGGYGGVECEKTVLLFIPVDIDILKNIRLTDIEILQLENVLNRSTIVGNILNILSSNELSVFDFLKFRNFDVLLRDINVCAFTLLNGVICK